jgi:hypothetical protein
MALSYSKLGAVRNSVLIVKHGGKTPLRRRNRRWDDNIKNGLKETGYEDVH